VGKSTVGKLLADRHSYVFLDTGVLYRAVSLAALLGGTSTTDPASLEAVARGLDVRILRADPGSGRMYMVCLGDKDVTDALRTPEVERIVSQVAAHPGVRAALLSRQREIARSDHSVLVGRDIGTVVLPDADLKVFLDAALEERARRRCLELTTAGRETTLQAVLQDLRNRDRTDSGRATSPLRVPDDALVVETDGKSVEAVLAEIEERMGPE